MMSKPAPSGESATKSAPAPMPPPVAEIPNGMDLINHVVRCLDMGCDPLDVRKQLMVFGFSEAKAERMIAETIEWMRTNPNAGKPVKASPLYWAVSNSAILVGIISCVIGLIALAMAATSDFDSRQYGFAGAAITFGIFAILWQWFQRAVR
jgi:hypothetical protein